MRRMRLLRLGALSFEAQKGRPAAEPGMVAGLLLRQFHAENGLIKLCGCREFLELQLESDKPRPIM